MSEVQIVHLPERDRWEAVDRTGSQERAVGYLSYERLDGVLDLQHTVVDPARRGRGLAGRLVQAAFEHAREQDLRVRPTCPYIPSWLRQHPEHQDLLDDGPVRPQVPHEHDDAPGDVAGQDGSEQVRDD